MERRRKIRKSGGMAVRKLMATRPQEKRKAPPSRTTVSSGSVTPRGDAGPRAAEGVREPSKVGKRGTVVIPAELRRRFGIEEGTIVIAEARDDGILIRPAVVLPVEAYTPERKAQFLLSTAVDRADYERAVRAVRAMGLDPVTIPHYKPPGV
jgi:AbrB family looped-hinge helix DNA binding protein